MSAETPYNKGLALMQQLAAYTTPGMIIDAEMPAPALHWRSALDQWLAHLDSAATIRNYKATIAHLFDVPGMPAYVSAVTPEMLTAWRGAMVARTHLTPGNERKISAATVNRHLCAARAFFNYWRSLSTSTAQHVAFTGDAQKEALKAMRAHVEKPFAVLVSDDEMGALIDATQEAGTIDSGKERLARKTWERKGNASAERDALIITVALASGLRCAELAALTVGSLVHDGWRDAKTQQQCEAWALDVKSGKGNKDRRVWISAEDAQALLDYIATTDRKYGRPADAETPLFLSIGNRNKGGRMAVDSIRRIIDSAADRAQAAGKISAGKVISPHSLRHTYALDLLRGDEATGRRPATILEVQALLGHASVTTTQRYLDHLGSHDRADLAPSISRLRHRSGANEKR